MTSNVEYPAVMASGQGEVVLLPSVIRIGFCLMYNEAHLNKIAQ
jgi:hypothetical protein